MGARELFADVKTIDDNITRYQGRLRLRHLIVGGIPSNKRVIESWLRAKMDLGDDAIRELVDKTMEERKDRGEVAAFSSTDEAVKAVAESELAPSINGFKRDAGGVLVYETRNFKAGLKEGANSAFPGTQWDRGVDSKGVVKDHDRPMAKYTPLRKGLQSTLEERVFPAGIYLQLQHENDDGTLVPVTSADVSPDPEVGFAWVEERIKHVTTAQGKRSSINRVEVVLRPVIDFQLAVHDDFLSREGWARLWTRFQDLGIGADRGRSDGSFDLLQWERIG